MTSIGKELTRISIVNSSCKVVYDSLVKPDLPIIDYLTRFALFFVFISVSLTLSHGTCKVIIGCCIELYKNGGLGRRGYISVFCH